MKINKKRLSSRDEESLIDCDSVGIRTRDPLIKSQMLYRLSYRIYFDKNVGDNYFKAVANICLFVTFIQTIGVIF